MSGIPAAGEGAVEATPFALDRSRLSLASPPNRVIWNCARWAFGVIGPIWCFAQVIAVHEYLSEHVPVDPRARVLSFCAVFVLAMAVSTLRPARGDLLSALLAGVLITAATFAARYALAMTLVGLIFIWSLDGLLALVPLAATFVYCRSAWLEMRSSLRPLRLERVAVLVLGFALPGSVGRFAHDFARRAEDRLVATYVDVESPPSYSELPHGVYLAWIHDWPRLREIYREGPFDLRRRVVGPRAQRAGSLWTALTGKPDYLLRPTSD
jgi:hypothetical protein